MNAKEYLMQVRQLDARLEVINASITRLKADIDALTDVSVKSAWPDGQPHGTKTTDPTGTMASRIADATEEQRRMLRKELLDYEYMQLQAKSELWKKQIEVIDTIGHVKDPTLYRILSYRYIDGRPFEWIAVEINYTWRHTIRLHGDALQEVQTILDKRKKN